MILAHLLTVFLLTFVPLGLFQHQKRQLGYQSTALLTGIAYGLNCVWLTISVKIVS
jgi:hypothetical protein